VLERHVRIRQKVLKYRPVDKLQDCFINMLAGGAGVVETNHRVRPSRGLQHAFGRQGCAEQSTISDTLNACTAENVAEMRAALQVLFRQHSRSYRHAYEKHYQVLDIDMTGMPAGRQGEGVSKGYFAHARNRRGRQLGRVLATHYDEIVVDRLYPGKRQLEKSLRELVSAAEEVLALDEARRRHTILRTDAGGGDDDNIDWLLQRGYHLITKVKNWRRAHTLAQSVSHWYVDPKVPLREVGWVTQPHLYAQPTRQLAVRHRKRNGQWSYHVLVFTLSDEIILTLLDRRCPPQRQPQDMLLAALHLYDQRGGGIETQTRGDKQGLALARRNKKHFPAQEVLVLLAQFAHNLIIWVRHALQAVDPQFNHLGIQRMVRDVFHIEGLLCADAHHQIHRITLNKRHKLARSVCHAFARLFDADDLSFNLGKI
jgi:hypothetical protein